MGGTYLAKGETSKAIKTSQRSLNYFRSLKKQSYDSYLSQMFALRRMGIAYFRDNNIEMAIQCWEQEVSLADSAGLPERLSYNLLGTAYHKQGNLEKALKFYKKAAALFKRFTREGALTSTYKNIGNVYRDMKDWQNARGYYEQALNRSRDQTLIVQVTVPGSEGNITLKNKNQLVGILEQIAYCTYMLGDYAASRGYFAEVIQQDPRNAHAYYDLARVHCITRAAEMAIKTLESGRDFLTDELRTRAESDSALNLIRNDPRFIKLLSPRMENTGQKN